MTYIPLFLTILRLLFSITIIFPCTAHITQSCSTYNLGCLALFICLALTDYLDGFIAKRYNAKTYIGSILDPLADKVLVFSALLPMAIKGIVPGWFCYILFIRDFAIGSLREATAQKGIQLKPIFLAKIKTTFLLGFIAYLYYNPSAYMNISLAINKRPEYVIPLLIVILSLLSLMLYLKKALKIQL